MTKIQKDYEVGQEVSCQCSKCKSEMVHVITVVKDGKIKKVMCKGCYTTHVYKPATVGEEPKRRRGRKPKIAGEKPVRRSRKKDWTTLVSDIDDSRLAKYDINGDYTEVRAIQHERFGVGVITKVIAHNKIEVVFQDEIRILAQNWE